LPWITQNQIKTRSPIPHPRDIAIKEPHASKPNGNAGTGGKRMTPNWPEFKEELVIGWNLLDVVDWVKTSEALGQAVRPPGGMPIIAMPPMQRTAVWRPKQVLDLWDSLMRGLPIGTLYLV
jgi:hypothetical protein